MNTFRFYNPTQIEGRGLISLEDWKKRDKNYTYIQWASKTDILKAIPDVSYIPDDLLSRLVNDVCVSYDAYNYLSRRSYISLTVANTFDELYELWEKGKADI